MSFILKFINKLRKLGLKITNPNYVKKKLKKRVGKCKKCGQCCISCKYLKNKLCTIYKNRPWWCNQDFPIDKFEQKSFGVKDCGYKFTK